MKILIADDNEVERLILSRLLEQEGHQVILAENGRQAIDYYFQHSPSLVFLDILMPQVDGYEVASAITQASDRRWIPIIFLTSLTDVHDLARCISCGGDDFVTKPINRVIIKAKVDAFSRIHKLYETIEQQKVEIQKNHNFLVDEQEAAKKIFDNIVHLGCLDSPNINYHLSPMSLFNGDLMLATETPMGTMRLMLADFTGHGLPASIGAIPASELFYSMSLKGFSLSDVMAEMNKKLYALLPRGVFCCVIVAEIGAVDEQITIWNAGSPQAYLIDSEKQSVKGLSSTHLPLAIQPPELFRAKPEVFHFGKTHRLIMATDGLIESTDHNSVMYGEKRLFEYIQKHSQQDNLCQQLVDQLILFTKSNQQADDLSILEVSFPLHKERQENTNNINTSRKKAVKQGNASLDFNFSLTLRGHTLRELDPIPLLLQVLLESKELEPQRSRVFTVLSELYNNALDHGVLGLESSIKNSKEGFARYFSKRNDRLVDLDEGFVKLELDHKPTPDGGEIIFNFIDSGEGFDFDKLNEQQEQKYSGRGLPLVLGLCDSVEFLEQGRHIRAVYRWLDKENHHTGANE